MRDLRTVLRSTAFAASLLATSFAAAQGVDAQVRTTIESQIAAFLADDASAAYAFASPPLQKYFGTPSRFMEMVRSGYGPVYRASNVRFGRFATKDGKLLQEVRLTGPKGKNWVALYALEEQPDGTLRITGCQLLEDPDVGV